MSMKYVMIYNDWPERTRRLSAADKGRLVDALMAYARGEDPEPLLQGNEQFLFDDLRLQYDRDREQYERKCQQRVDAIEARWNAVRNEKQATAEERTSHGETETDTPAAPSRAQAEKPTAAVSSLAAGADVYPRNTSDTTVYSRNTDDTDVSCRIQEEEKEKDKYKEKYKDTTTSSTIVPRPVKNEEEEWEHHSSLLDKLRNGTREGGITIAETHRRGSDGFYAERTAGKATETGSSSPSPIVPFRVKEEEHCSYLLDKLRNGTREGVITSAETQRRGSDNIRVEETGIFADDPHDKENSTVADVAEEKAEDAARGERNAEEPVCAERIAGKAEDAICWERAAEKAEDAVRMETFAGPADSSSPSAAVPHWIKEEEHCSYLLDKLRNGTRESATTIAEQQGREGDAIQAERTAGKATETGSSSPSAAVPHWVKEEKEQNERESDSFGHGTEKASPAEAAKQSGRAHPPLPPVFHDDLIDSIKAMDAPRGENIAKPTYSVSPSPSSSAAVPHWVKEEQELKERESGPFGHGTEKAGPADAVKHSSQAHPPLPPVFHDALIDSIKAMDAPRGENIAKPTYSVSPSPSSAVPHWIKEEQELKEQETDSFGHGTEKAGPTEAAKHSGRAHPPLPPVFHDDMIDSIKAMGQEKTAHDDKQEEKSMEKSAENRDGTVSASTSGERHTALTAGHEGKTTPATAHEGQITPARNHDGYVDSAASYEEKTAPDTEHEGKTASAVGHEWHAATAAAHEGKTSPGEGHEGQAAAVEDYEEHPSTTANHEERTASEAGHEWHAATPANHEENAVSTTKHEEKTSAAVDHEGKTAPVAAHEGKCSISAHEEQAVTDAEREGKAPIAADQEEHTSANTAHEGKASAAADQEEKPASTAIPSSFEAWLALSEIALPQDEPPADGASHTAGPFSQGGTYPDAAPASALPRNFEELCRAANLPCEAEHLRMAEALARQYSADWLADAMLLAGFERRTANWRYVAGVLRNAKQRGYVSLNLPNRDPTPASYRDASSPFRGPYDPPQPAGYDPGREYGSRRDHDDEEINRVLNRVWRMAMEEAEKEKEGAKARDGG